MKKVLRLTESDLVRVIKRIVNESEEYNAEEYMDYLINNGYSNLQAYYLTQLEMSDDTNWKTMFDNYGEVIAHDLFSNDYSEFLDFVFQINEFKEGGSRWSFYRRWDGGHGYMINVLTEYFFKGDKKLMIEKYGEYLDRELDNQQLSNNKTLFIEHEIYKTYREYKNSSDEFEELLFSNYLDYPDRYRNLFDVNDTGNIFYLYIPFNVDGVYDLIDILYN